MADNFAFTPGSGATGAADEIGGVLFPRVKVTHGADGTATDVSAAAPLPIDLVRWAFDVPVAPTVTAGAYSANDIMGGLLTFADVARASAEGVIITGAQVISKAAVTLTGLKLVLFNANPSATTQTDNAAYSLNAADAFKVIKGISFTSGDTMDHGTPNSISLDGLTITAVPVARALYGLLIDSVGLTLVGTTDIQVRLRGVGA